MLRDFENTPGHFAPALVSPTSGDVVATSIAMVKRVKSNFESCSFAVRNGGFTGHGFGRWQQSVSPLPTTSYRSRHPSKEMRVLKCGKRGDLDWFECLDCSSSPLSWPARNFGPNPMTSCPALWRLVSVRNRTSCKQPLSSKNSNGRRSKSKALSIYFTQAGKPSPMMLLESLQS